MNSEAPDTYRAVRQRATAGRLPHPDDVVNWHAEGKIGKQLVEMVTVTKTPALEYPYAPPELPTDQGAAPGCSDPTCTVPITGWRDYQSGDHLERIWIPCGHAR